MDQAVLVIAGPTASGKSALSMRLADKLHAHQRELETISMEAYSAWVCVQLPVHLTMVFGEIPEWVLEVNSECS